MGQPWEPGYGKAGKCPELRDSREVSAGVRVDPEAHGVKGLSTSRFSSERDPAEPGSGRPLASSRGWTTMKCIRELSGYSTL